jgi:hypothetical protein
LLLLSVATGVLWVRSYWINDNYGISHRSGIGTERGELTVMIAGPDSNFSFEREYSHEQLPRSDETYNPRRVAAHTWNLVVAHGEQFPGLRIIVVKLWAIVVPLACPFAIMTWRLGRRGRSNRSCSHCGYNLAGNTSGVCPECGTAIATKAAAKT